MKRKVYYVLNKRLMETSKNISNICNRAYVVQSLIASYNLLQNCVIIEGEPATDDEILSFHCRDYLDYIKKVKESSGLEIVSDAVEADDFNLGYDCPVFGQIYEYIKLIAGSSLSAARRLISHRPIDVTKQLRSVKSDIVPRSYLKFTITQSESKGNIFDLPSDLSADESIKFIKNDNFGSKRRWLETKTTINKDNTRSEQKVAVNWFGGWHHAQRDAAEGFCYVNDIVIAVQYLLKSFSRVLYIDLDVHHGNGVENAFQFSPRVLVLSIHKYETGFYPGTGSVYDIGLGNGKYHTVNIPLKDGITDDMYVEIFSTVFHKVYQKYKPECIVMQCGADSLASDPLGGFNLTPLGIGHCLRLVLDKGLPTLVLGGGGYNVSNVARCWAYLTSIILESAIENDIPDNSYFNLFGPDFELAISPTLRKNENSKDYVQKLINTVLQNLDNLPNI